MFVLHPHQDVFNAPAAMCIPVPDAIPTARAVLAANMETALNIMWDAAPLAGERVLVIGAGVVGLLTAALLARIPATRVTLIDIDPSRAALARRFGCTFAHPAQAPRDQELIVHASGSEAGLRLALDRAGFEARIIEASWFADRAPSLPLGEAFHPRRLRLVASQVGSIAAPMRGRRSYAERLATGPGAARRSTLRCLAGTVDRLPGPAAPDAPHPRRRPVPRHHLREHLMYSLTVCDHIMIAHSFHGAEFGPAQRLHGATFAVEAEFRALQIDHLNLLIDIGLARTELRRILDGVDYINLDDVTAFAGQNTTTEFMARHIHGLLAAACTGGALGDGGKKLESLKVLLRESPVAWAAFEGPLALMHLALLLPGPLDIVSGGYIYDRRIVDGLRAAGHRVDVVPLSGTHPLADDAALASARAAWQALPADALPVIDGLALPAFAPLAGEIAARRTIGLIHHPVSLETGLAEPDKLLLHDVERALMPALAHCIVTSPMTADTLASGFGVDPKRISIVVPGTEEAPRSPGSGGPGCEILSIGTLQPRKGHDILLRAVARLFDLDWHLTIAGDARDPVYAHSLQALAEELNIAQRVRFEGVLVGDALEALWQRSDVFALATHYEGYGMVIAEALKRGMPVAVTAGGAAAALVTPECGAVCDVGDVVQFSKCLRHLIFDVRLRRDMAEAAWQVGKTLPDWNAQATAFAAALA